MPNEFSNADYKMAADKQPKEKTSVTVEPLGPVASQERPKQSHFPPRLQDPNSYDRIVIVPGGKKYNSTT